MDYGPVPTSRYSEVIEHLRHNFFADEPLNQSLGLCKPGEPHQELEKHSLSTLQDGMSIMAVDLESGEIAGIALNGIIRKGDLAIAQQQLQRIPDAKYREIFGFLYKINERVDLFTKYETDSIFDFRMLSVDHKYRGKGIARDLLIRSELIAEEYGFKLIKMDATSFFSQKMATSAGYVSALEVLYSEYRDKTEYFLSSGESKPSPKQETKKDSTKMNTIVRAFVPGKIFEKHGIGRKVVMIAVNVYDVLGLINLTTCGTLHCIKPYYTKM